jgi:dCTP deaminase
MTSQILSSRSDGVFAYQDLQAAVKATWVIADLPFEEEQFQPASLDLRLGKVAYQLRASFLPFLQTVQMRINEEEVAGGSLTIDRISLESGALLSRGSVYLIPLLESLKLPKSVRGRCNPKIDPGYHGPLFLEVSPQSFPVRVRTGLSLNQLRLVTGRAALSDTSLHELYRMMPLLYGDDLRPLPVKRRIAEGLCMGVDLQGKTSDGIIGYRAHRDPPAVDLSRTDFYDPSEFWEPIKRPIREAFILEANRFYILASKERIRVPPELAAEMVVYDAGAGEIRTHYAGFFDPGFGYSDGSLLGTKVVMEVRAHGVPFMLYDGQTLFKVGFERLKSRPRKIYGTDIGSSYQNQSLTLSKQFRRG